MKRAVSFVIACLAAGSFAAAQQTQTDKSKTTTETGQSATHTETTVKHKGPGKDTAHKMETVTGTVKDFEAGKKITVTGPGDKSYSFDLDENARVSDNVAVGSKVKVQYWKDENGKERVSVVSVSGGAAVGEATMPRSHTETTVKHHGANVKASKEKIETVVGTVKEFEAGKKIVVTGPGDKDYRFDLDEHASVGSNVAVGERVKVTYQKGDNGDKVTHVTKWSGKA